VIELLAITDAPLPPPRPPVRAISGGGLSVLCAPAADPPQEPTADALWRHEALIEELMEDRDLLPVRFGTVVADDAAAARAVADRRDELAAGLDRVRGAVELALRAHEREGNPLPAARSGREYMRARTQRTAAARQLHEPLAALARDSVVQSGPELLRAAYLVDRDRVEAFVALVRRLQDDHPALDLLCTGPWPPYSFAERRERS
jgi:hypothetical protein